MQSQVRLCGVILVAAVAVMCCTDQAWAAAKQVGDQVQEQPAPPDRGSVIVYFDANANRGPARRFVSNNGGVAHYEYKTALPNAINFRNLPDTAIAGLERIPGVMRVERDEYHANLIKLHDSTPLIRALQSQITGAGYSADGVGVRVCVCDTGIDSDHLMYSDRIDASAGYDFYNDDSDPEDDNGHGSHVSGIAVGGTGLSVDFGCGAGDQVFQGVAPEATLIGAKILNQYGGGYDSDIIAGIDHCADQSPSGGRADVINLSIGIGQYSEPCTHSWAVAANNAVANGVVVVAASGNENYSNAMSSPACGVNVIAVGMTWKADYPTCEDPTTNWYWSTCTDYGPQTDDIGCFSNESDYLDVAAPGANIWSASNAAGGSSITGMSGTSMSSPQVVGLAALILSVDDTLTPAEVRQIIRDGAIDMGPTGFDRAYGYGRIDVLDTLALLEEAVCGDDTCNGTEDQCTCPEDCGTPPSVETGLCDDGIDNDCDTDVDCDDADCATDPACLCDNDGTCEPGEDCHTCPNDCFEGSGAECGNGICETADGEDCRNCSADCNGRTTGAPSGRFCCGDSVGCDDSRCTEGSFDCTDQPAAASCCGDLVCEGTENVVNCAVDCGCTVPADCDDSNECTIDDCVGGVCENTPVADDTPCTGGICCGGTCDDAVCSSGADCNDSEACTTDTCYNAETCDAYCDNTWPACGISDGCCGPACDSGNDPDCEECVPDGGYCTTNEDCCSLSCHPAKNYCR